MTALKQYQRLETIGLWRSAPDAQRREVAISLGDATLVLSDMNDRPLTHWSLTAIERANPGQLPARYHPDGDPGEVLELSEESDEMIAAIERLRREIARRRPRQGRLRWVLGALALTGCAGMAVFWLPDALVEHTLRVVPDVKRDAIGLQLLNEVSRVTGPPCRAEASAPALRMLARRMMGADRAGDLIVVRAGNRVTAHLPGGFILLNSNVLEDNEDPEAAAGYVLAEDLRAAMQDPLEPLLQQAGMWATARLLTTGQLPLDALQNYGETLMGQAPRAIPIEDLLQGFEDAKLHATPYAYAIDVTGESTLTLIEADPMAAGGAELVMSDNDWLRLQTICEG